jgi:hypothetical protein
MQYGPELHRKQYWFTVSICHLVKIYLKTLESNCNSKNYLANSRFVGPIDLLTLPIGSKPMSLEILFYLLPMSRKKASLGTRMARGQPASNCSSFSDNAGAYTSMYFLLATSYPWIRCWLIAVFLDPIHRPTHL